MLIVIVLDSGPALFISHGIQFMSAFIGSVHDSCFILLSEQIMIDDIYNTEQGIVEKEEQVSNGPPLLYQSSINTVELVGTYHS